MSDLLEQVVQPQEQSYRTIQLTQGKVTIVDAADYKFLSKYKWHAVCLYKNSLWYASAVINGKTAYIHRFVCDGKRIDHINGNGLDNRRENLRPCTHAQNLANRDKNSNNTTGYKGVWKRDRKRPFRACIRVAAKTIHLGSHCTAKEAAVAYDKAAIRYFGDYAQLNFPRADYSDK